MEDRFGGPPKPVLGLDALPLRSIEVHKIRVQFVVEPACFSDVRRLSVALAYDSNEQERSIACALRGHCGGGGWAA